MFKKSRFQKDYHSISMARLPKSRTVQTYAFDKCPAIHSHAAAIASELLGSRTRVITHYIMCTIKYRML